MIIGDYPPGADSDRRAPWRDEGLSKEDRRRIGVTEWRCSTYDCQNEVKQDGQTCSECQEHIKSCEPK